MSDNNKIADLHIHSNYSDGIYDIQFIVEKALNHGISVISITDHDTIDGCEETYHLCKENNIEFITGIELSCFEELKEFHILGYGFDPDFKPLKEHLKQFKIARLDRAEKILTKLEKFGIKISIDSVLGIADKSPIIRPHIATALMNKGYVKTIKEAFQQYLGDWKSAYVPKQTFRVEKAIKLINEAGGIASLAHPGPFIDQDDLYRMIQTGLDAIEVVHPIHDESLIKFYHSVANQYWLYETGGSDYHGNREYDDENFGKFYIPYSKYLSLKNH